MSMTYDDFVASKFRAHVPCGLTLPREAMSDGLFDHQKDLARWSLARGKTAIFAATGLGKSRMQLEWARHVATRGDVLILAPLSVAKQTAREGLALGVEVAVCRELADVRPGVNITNYDRLHKFDTSRFAGVVLDESSIIKNETARTLKQLIDAFRDTPFKLCATATPSPNDYTELGTHAEFLGVCSRTEMLAEFFCHDGGETQVWRLKGHARGAFWRWVASWAALVRSPSDLGYDGSAYVLPPLTTHQHVIAADPEVAKAAGVLFAQEVSGLMDRKNARKASLDGRVSECVATVRAEPAEAWIVWCELNSEQDALADAFGDDCVSIYGSLDADEKEARMQRFLDGDVKILVSKPSIAGFGVNAQIAARMAFVGVTDSWESYHQAVRRCWRFGQTRPVHVHVFSSEAEGPVVRNLERKQRDADKMAEELSGETRDAVMAEVLGMARTVNDYNAKTKFVIPAWLTTEEEGTEA